MKAVSGRSRILTVVGALSLIAAAAFAQRQFGGYGGGYGRIPPIHNVGYDGQFTFVRVSYETAPGGYWSRNRPSWVHGYPLAEENLMRIMNDLSFLGARTEDINVLTLDDPEIFRYPLIYIIEVGWWTLTDTQAAALRTYIKKGGFVIVDDFKTEQWTNDGTGGWEPFANNMQRVLPGVRFFEMKPSDPIFHSFFEIETLDNFPQAYNSGRPVFRAVYEDNDPRKRLVMVVNYNTDISQFWEWSGRGLRSVDQTNEAYKLGVNYLMYGMTH
ncbi:MAG TPA: DUF4159 domain-containing protein [Vicinamibacterales bacterium]|jgi:hypothetical protein